MDRRMRGSRSGVSGVVVALVLALCGSAHAAGSWSGDSFEQARRAGEARVVFAYVPAEGFAGTGADGEPDGATVALLRDFGDWVQARHGIALAIDWQEETDWSRFYARVRDGSGGVFGVGNVTITEARRGELAFSPPYMDNVAVLVTHRRVPELAALEDIGEAFAGLGAAVFPGTLHEQRLDALAKAHFSPPPPTRPVASNDELIALVAGDGAWFTYVDAYNLLRAQARGLPLRRHPVGDDASERFGVIMPHGSDWEPVIEAFFEADGGYTRTPRWRDHLRRHLGEALAEELAGPRTPDPRR